MDYRNDSKLSYDNTIIYGHNLANKTAFGSLDNLFTDKWFKESNHLIVVRNRKKKYVYKVLSMILLKTIFFLPILTLFAIKKIFFLLGPC